MNNQEKNEVIKNIIGKWIYEDENTKIVITINNKSVCISYKEVIEEFENEAHWLGENHLCFVKPYYITFADDMNMKFGKLNSINLGDYEWEYNLSRIS